MFYGRMFCIYDMYLDIFRVRFLKLTGMINNPDLNPDKQKGDELNDVDVDACRKELQLFLRGYSHAMLHLCDKGLCSDNVKNNLRPSKFDLGAHDWHWGIKARSQINSALQTK